MRGIEAKEHEVVMDALGAPQAVLTVQLANEFSHFFVNGWPSAFPRLTSPEETEALPVPLDDGSGLHQMSGTPPIRPETAKESPKEAEGWRESWSWLFPVGDAMFEDRELAFCSEEPGREAGSGR